jgi:(p)ppGpp synthase/HD superfamily hydrolase
MQHDPVIVRFARFYATIKHAGQLYGGTLPYTHHLEAVDRNVQYWFERAGTVPLAPGGLDTLRAAAWLHDVQEDCGVKNRELEELFGANVASIVEATTDELGDTRNIRHALTDCRRKAPGFSPGDTRRRVVAI